MNVDLLTEATHGEVHRLKIVRVALWTTSGSGFHQGLLGNSD